MLGDGPLHYRLECVNLKPVHQTIDLTEHWVSICLVHKFSFLAPWLVLDTSLFTLPLLSALTSNFNIFLCPYFYADGCRLAIKRLPPVLGIQTSGLLACWVGLNRGTILKSQESGPTHSNEPFQYNMTRPSVSQHPLLYFRCSHGPLLFFC